MISLPFQNKTLFGVGPDDDVANVLNIQPVIPFTVGDWNIINRTIAPVIYLPDVTAGLPELPEGVNRGSTFGLGDINTSFYFSPAKPGPIIWGIGPSLTLPTATNKKIGSQKWSAGPAAVALAQPGPWVVGTLVRQLWSFAGDGDRQDVSQLLIQPFVNYNMADGWYLVSAPIITANWEADSDDTWTVPVAGGFGKIFRIGNQPINAHAGLLQRRAPAVRPRVDHALPAPVPVPEIADRSRAERQEEATRMRDLVTIFLAAIFAACVTTAAAQDAAAPPLVEQINGGNWLKPQETEELRDELFYQRA